MINLYVIWYGSASVVAISAWIFSRKVEPYWKKYLIRTGVISMGFTTVPVLAQDGGVIIPIGIYFLSRSHWLEAAGVASITIGLAWAILFACSVSAGYMWNIRRDMKLLAGHFFVSVLIAVPATALGLFLFLFFLNDSWAMIYWLLLFPNIVFNILFAGGLFSFHTSITGAVSGIVLQLLYYFFIVIFISWLVGAIRGELPRRIDGSGAP